MTERRLPTPATAGRDAFRELSDRLDRLETLVQNIATGAAPLGYRLGLGDVTLAVEETTPSTRTVRFTNTLNGVSTTLGPI